MIIAKVIGQVIATRKDPQLQGVAFKLVQPLDENLKPRGAPLVTADAINAREGDIVFYVTGREGTLTLSEEDRRIPTDAGIVGLVDNLSSDEL